MLREYGVEMIGANRDAIKVAENRLLFKQAMDEAGLEMPRGGFAKSWDEAEEIVQLTGYPAIIRPSFTLGGTGGGIAYNPEEFEEIVRGGLAASPIHEVLIEESILGWKEFELEVMRDLADNVVIICSIENFDPMGVHTGDSITLRPRKRLTDREYQLMRDMAIRVIRKVGVETGGSNIQFGVNPENGEVRIIEMNRACRALPALASKATGFPIAKIAAKLAVGYTLDEIPNDITRKTPASFEPTIDYVVAKIPKWDFEKFREAGRRARHADEVGRRGDGHRPHVQGSAVQRTAFTRSRQAAATRRHLRRRTATQARAAKLATLLLHHLRASARLAHLGNLSSVADRSVVSRSVQAGDGDSARHRRLEARGYLDGPIACVQGSCVCRSTSRLPDGAFRR